MAKEICEDCGKLFEAGKRAFLCPACRKKRQSETARRNQAIKKFEKMLDTWFAGNQVRGFYLPLASIYECRRVYQEMTHGKHPHFISADVKRVLDYCKIPTRQVGIGWEVI